MRLEDTTIAVTGGGNGTGAAMARAFAAEGAHVGICDVDQEGMEAVVADSEDATGSVTSVHADVGEREDVRRFVGTVREAFGPVDVLVNNAALRQVTAVKGDAEPVHEVDPEVWDAVIGTNLTGAFLCTRAVLPGMLDRGEGRLLYLASGLGERGKARRAPYAASKFGLNGFCESLADELAGTGVDAVRFRPGGAVATEPLIEAGQPAGKFVQEPADVTDPLVKLAAGAGVNGGLYKAVDDGLEAVSLPSEGD